jgi:hypothetical protein
MKGITIGAEYMKVVIGHRPEAKSVAGGRKKSYIIKLGDCTITKSGITKSGEARLVAGRCPSVWRDYSVVGFESIRRLKAKDFIKAKA